MFEEIKEKLRKDLQQEQNLFNSLSAAQIQPDKKEKQNINQVIKPIEEDEEQNDAEIKSHEEEKAIPQKKKKNDSQSVWQQQRNLTRNAQGKFMSLNKTSNKTKKIKKEKKIWTPNHRLVYLGELKLIPEDCTKRYGRYKYQITFGYKILPNSQTTKTCKIYFGRKDQIDYVDNFSEQTRMINLRNMKQGFTPFDKNFWRRLMLNNQQDLKQNYQQIIQQYMY